MRRLVLFAAALGAALALLHNAEPPVLADEVTRLTFAVARLAGLGLGWYIAVTAAIGAAVRGTRMLRLTAVVDAITLPAVRRVLNGAIGVTMMTTVAAPVMTVVTTRPVAAATADEAAPPPLLRRLPPAAPPTFAAIAPTATCSVARGDHFWKIAQRVLSERWGRPPTNAELVPYWHRLIDANRQSLRDPSNPNRIYVNQVFVLPEP